MSIDPVIKDHQLWIGFVQPEGLVVSPHALKNAQAVLSRNVAAQQEILRRHTLPDTRGISRLKNFPAFTQEFWGWRESDLAAPPDELSARLPEYGETLRPSWIVRGGKGQPEHLILVQELPFGIDFDTAAQQSEEQRWHAPPQSRFERLLRETGVAIGLLVSSERVRLVYAPKGESSGHLTFPVHQMTMAANWPMLAALHLLLHSDRLFIGPEAQRLPVILEASRRYQNEVSIRLAGQVLRALNELVRGFQDADRAAHGAILKQALEHDPSHIYGGMLTTLMRMVFVLYAEDRSLMGSDETWLQNYSVSGLYERLRADAGQYPDTMDSRYGAWAQIITLTRLLYDGGGHGSWRVPARHGGLFDPDAYPFLEGRPWGSNRASVPAIEPPLVSDGVLFRILQDLLYLDGERISYRALDVEQIGSVYEAMMGFTVETAHGTSIGLGSEHLVLDLEELLAKKPGDRAKSLKEDAGCEVTGKALEQLKSAATVDELLAALRRRISKLYLDQNSNAITVPPAGIYLQPTEERRRSGSHYTPRSLTQPIVKTTLDPVVAQLGDNPNPEQILALKVCDPAMGSGAFLVEACRYLGEKLEKAWIAHDETPPIPADQDPLLHARRMVAQRCLYGVDKNPFAVNLAKLSLWLATFAKDHPFTFVDHTLRCGDSLVGLTAHQIEAFHWQPKEEGALIRDLPSRLRHILNARAQILDAADETPYETLAQKLAVTEEQMIDLRLAGDLAVAAFFAAEKPKDREVARKALAEKVRRAREHLTDLELEEELQSVVRMLKTGAKGVLPFHWELEFPEVFRIDPRGTRAGGFDAFVGNPPFMGGSKLSTAAGNRYNSWLGTIHVDSRGKSDLVAHFFRRAFAFLRPEGTLGLIATNTIRQGDTRETGLFWIRTNGGTIYNARTRRPWPGAAAVVVSVVHVVKSTESDLKPVLDGRPVDVITAYLFHMGPDGSPATLGPNKRLVHSGTNINGKGFVITPDARDAFIAECPMCADRIRDYLGAEEMNEAPDAAPTRCVIYMAGLVEDEVKRYAPIYKHLYDTVRVQRRGSSEVRLRERWWLYSRPANELYLACAGMRRILASGRAGSHLCFLFQSTSTIFSDSLTCFIFDTYYGFAVLQSRVHEVWARFFGSSLKDDPRYIPEDCFETFPFPSEFTTDPALESAGREYYEHRSSMMLQTNNGLTKTYNRFHNPDASEPDIVRLRELHAALDRAVLDSYGWNDIPTECEFFPEFDDQEGEDECAPATKFRYRWSDSVRDEVLGRMLELNRRRAEEETQGAPVVRVPPAKIARAKRSKPKAPLSPPTLFVSQEPAE